MNIFQDKHVLVTGCCGTIGRELIRLLLDGSTAEVSSITGIDNNESGIFYISQEYKNNSKAHFEIGDVRDRDRLVDIFEGINIVLHCAALKHVESCEMVPFDAVQTNIHGVQNVISAAQKNKVERVIFTSSDKAVNPTNVMGTSKLMGERLMTAANTRRSNHTTIFASTRFGNVLGSNGSVVPLFKQQILSGGPVTLTDARMTRFIMSVEDAALLVLDTVGLAKGGEVFITKMPVIKITDLAHAMIRHYERMASTPIDIVEIGAKPGEKLYEELMSGEETQRAVELEKYFAVLPAFRNLYHEIDYIYPGEVSKDIGRAYVSSQEPAIEVEELREYLVEHDLLS